jgi:glucose/arabinose dehydrogenase
MIVFAIAGIARADEPAPQIFLKLVDKGFENPLYFVHDPAGRNFVVEQPGRVWMLVNGKKSARPYLDIAKKVHMEGESGMLSIAFHPDFEKNGRLFVDYIAKPPNREVVAEYHVDPKAAVVDPATEKVLLEVPEPQSNHNGGLLLFGPDGMLYIGLGDGGAGGDTGRGHVEPGGNAQNLHQLLGKILRIDVNQATKSRWYSIPKDNPCFTGLDCEPEIYALGLRNPWRFSFDRKTGILYCGDVGQNTYEEVDIITKGGNYGWRVREGLHPFRGKEKPTTTPLIDPIIEYDHHTGLSITGGYVYRGKQFPELTGMYLYADYSKGRIWGLKYDGQKMTWHHELQVTVGQRTGQILVAPASFGEDIDGELYICDVNYGIVYQVQTK